MSIGDAWIVTALGMSVVFTGLVACIGLIHVVNRMSRHVTWTGHGHGHGAPPVAAAPAPALAPAEPADPGPPIPADVLAVIAVVLEVERKLYMNRPGARVTIRRQASLS